ncbi:MAG: DUF5348 domain-containing protein [Lachnospiraceae bacterium]|nr:DUF5348 domain-containing protein [Lachnospiraceae bacterium]
MKEGTLAYDCETGRYNMVDGTGRVIVDGLHCGDVLDVYEAELYAGDPARQEEADREKRWVSARIEADDDDAWFLIVNGETKLFEKDPGDRALQGIMVRV